MVTIGHGIAQTLYMQAWHTYCREGRLCNSSPQLPDKAYIISLPEETAKRSPLLSVLADLGLNPEYVEGILSDQVNTSSVCSEKKCTSHTRSLALILVYVLFYGMTYS